jgi:hypothetical protein
MLIKMKRLEPKDILRGKTIRHRERRAIQKPRRETGNRFFPHCPAKETKPDDEALF